MDAQAELMNAIKSGAGRLKKTSGPAKKAGVLGGRVVDTALQPTAEQWAQQMSRSKKKFKTLFDSLVRFLAH